VWVELSAQGRGYALRLVAAADDGRELASQWLLIADRPTRVAVLWRAAFAPGTQNGVAVLWAGSERAELVAIDNDELRVDQVSFGAVTPVDTGTWGEHLFEILP
jgi:hypothetical protein